MRNTARDGRYEIEKEVLTDPWRDVVLQRVRFVPHSGSLADYRMYVLLAPHLANRGSGNTAWVDEYKGTPMLFAERGSYALALACSAPWVARSVGFVGTSDGWQQLRADKRLTRTYRRAENGNVALTGQVDLRGSEDTFVLALGFGPTANEAGQHARISLLEGQWVQNIRVIMNRPASIAGTVLDDRGEPIVGAVVRVLSNASGWSKVTWRRCSSGRCARS